MGRVRLHALRLIGFKSFPDALEVGFPGDVAAIIGPNGCGKSNLVDAVLWVLGEQSPSLLRLKTMADVVFSGSAGRPAAGAAEVTLVLAADDGRWPENDGRLEITRRVFSTGPSDYRINGRAVRLRDLVDELHSVGLGTRGYAIIEQGKVGQVLSARPTDRRVLLEEAAGITRYKARRHDAELKLERTRQNLIRIEDVIDEVERSLRQLKRQARQAERHQKLETTLGETVRTLLVLDAHRVDAERSRISRDRARTQNEVAAAAATLGGAEADLLAARQTQEATRSEVEDVRTEVARLASSSERLEAFLERSADLLDSLRAAVARARQESATVESTLSTLEERVAACDARASELNEARTAAAELLAGATRDGTQAGRRLDEAEASAAKRRHELLRTISELTDSRNRLGDLERERDRLAYAAGQVEHERERIEQRLATAEERHRTTSDATRTTAAALDEVEGRRSAVLAERTRTQGEESAARQEAETRGSAAWDLRHRLQGVDRELARHAAPPEALEGIVAPEAIVGRVSDALAPAPEIAPLLDRVWSDRLDLPVVSLRHLDPDQLAAVAELESRLQLVVADAPPEAPPQPSLAGCEPLLPLAGAEAGALPWLSRTLSPAYRCDDAARARELADVHPGVVIVDPDGVVWRGRTLEPVTAAASRRGALSLRAERQELHGELAAAEEAAEQATARRTAAAEQLRRLEEELATLGGAVVRAEQEHARAAAAEEAAAGELHRLERELESLRGEGDRLRGGQRDAEQRLQRLRREVETLSARGDELERAVDQAAAVAGSRREEAAEASRQLERRRGDARLADERAAAANAERDRVAAELDRARARREELLAEASARGAELAETEQEVVRSRTRLAEEQGLLAAAREAERRAAERSRADGERVSRLDAEVRRRREEHDRTRQVLHEAEVEQARVDAEWQRVRDAAGSELGVAAETLLGADVAEDADPVALRAEVDRLRDSIERLGPVNLLAVQESEELGERAAFLGEQRDDLVRSLRSLDATIHDIDATCSERFVVTFEKVNGLLAETFNTLFGGGTARLELVDEDNPLESGIDITAQPPGKRNQSVQLLSGGEKALTALSLLIALFRARPAPVCILDEVDAPLDDANVERLADLVAAMTEHTQFILITHNRRTMARADVLYGVTMEEPGVSKVVSVRLES